MDQSAADKHKAEETKKAAAAKAAAKLLIAKAKDEAMDEAIANATQQAQPASATPKESGTGPRRPTRKKLRSGPRLPRFPKWGLPKDEAEEALANGWFRFGNYGDSSSDDSLEDAPQEKHVSYP